MSELIFNQSPVISIGTNLFFNVPVILRCHDVNLIEVCNNVELGYSLQIPIYHPDGTYLATAKNSRLFKTESGEKVGVEIDKHPGLWVCKMEGREIFEIRQQGPNLFKTTAELYTNCGLFLKCSDNTLVDVFNPEHLKIRNITLKGNKISGCRVAIDVKEDGTIEIFCN